MSRGGNDNWNEHPVRNRRTRHPFSWWCKTCTQALVKHQSDVLVNHHWYSSNTPLWATFAMVILVELFLIKITKIHQLFCAIGVATNIKMKQRLTFIPFHPDWLYILRYHLPNDWTNMGESIQTIASPIIAYFVR